MTLESKNTSSTKKKKSNNFDIYLASSSPRRTEIQFANLTANQCAKYWDTNEPKDKAGAYGIQGYGGLFVESLEGSYSNVVGLPIVETCKIFKEKNIGYWLNQ